MQTRHFDRARHDEVDRDARIAQARQEASFAREQVVALKKEHAKKLADVTALLDVERRARRQAEAHAAASDQARAVLAHQQAELAGLLRAAEEEVEKHRVLLSRTISERNELSRRLDEAGRQDREDEKLRRRLLEKERQNDELRREVARLRGLVPSEPLVYARREASTPAEKTTVVG